MWNCKHCSEPLEDTFEDCWRCGYARDGSPPPESVKFEAPAPPRPAVAAPQGEPAKPSLFHQLLWKIPVAALLVVDAIKATRAGEFRQFATILLLIFAAIGALFAVDRLLAKRKSPAWMSRFHVCLAIAFIVALMVLISVTI